MLAARLHGPGSIALEEVMRPAPGPGELLFKVEQAGICGSDVHVYKGHRSIPYPLTLGHEALGRVVEVGEGVSRVRLGQRVIVEPNIACGACEYCRRGQGTICPHKTVLGINTDGAFAEYLRVPATHAWAVPEHADWRDLIVVEPLAVAVHALAVSGVQPGDDVMVLGCGPEGLLLTALLTSTRIHVRAADLNPFRVQAARDLGAEAEVMTPETAETLQRELLGSRSPMTLFECSGSAEGTAWCINAVPRGGKVVLIGLSESPVPVQPLRYVREGMALVGSLIYDHPTDFRRALSLTTRGFTLGHLINRVFPFGNVQEGLEAAAAGMVLKGGLDLT